MPLEYSELEVIIEKIIETVRTDLITANRLGTLDLALAKYGIENDFCDTEVQSRNGTTILVLGACSISKADLDNLYKKFKLKRKTFEFVAYDEVTNFNFSKLIGNNKYTDIFVGPVPHKAMNIGKCSGVLEYLLSSKEIPAKITELKDSNGELKISKRTFKKALEESNCLNPF